MPSATREALAAGGYEPLPSEVNPVAGRLVVTNGFMVLPTVSAGKGPVR